MRLKTALLTEMARSCGYALVLAADLIDRNEEETLGSMLTEIIPLAEELREAAGRPVRGRPTAPASFHSGGLEGSA
jgi:hypothetical protein